MNTIIKSVFIIIVISVLTGGIILYFQNENATSEIIPTQGITAFGTRETYKIIVFDKGIFPTLFDQSEQTSLQTTEEILKERDALAVINAGYYREDLTHAGLLSMQGREISALAPNDNQLTHVLEIDLDSIYITEAKTFTPTTTNTAFQTGPLFIQNNAIKNDFIAQSLNGTGAYPRSIIGKTNTGEIFIAVSTSLVTLETLANNLLADSFLVNGIDFALNLDGGRSVSLASSIVEVELFEKRTLPYLLIF